ncbi:MAG: Mfa1 family fimbria major subunit [Muribaculaceae bacterium]|nr:Mfa1 family fimbria major subunit [Muribaculaceae bacterium]MDE6553196.1 Mfa1 family fimbria major subunit [Muribaculaceae bacterium]
MKLLRQAFLALATAALLPTLPSCSSDPNPFDIKISSERNTATIQLRLNVEETRAGELSTADENKLTKVTIHVFDDKHNLEVTKNVNITDGSNIVNLEVSNGLKTLYVVTAKSNVNPSKGISLTSYENSKFNSSLENIKTASDGFVMVGKSEEQQVMLSSSQTDLPSSNVFDIKLQRLVAKAQVRNVNANGSSFGISFGNASFKAFQLNERMMVLHNGSDVLDSYVDSNNNGTYDNYTLGVGNYLAAVTSDFKADDCVYMSENIVSKPMSGNSTFLSIRFATTPEKYYTFDSSKSLLTALTETPAASTTYYAVAIQDKVNGLVDYALDHTNNHILAFKSESDAESYKNSLNSGESSAITVSQTDKPMMISSLKKAPRTSNFEVVKFDGGYVYYRVNIAHEVTSGDATVLKKMVMRNRFYKVNINSVKSLGFGSEDLLRPSNPEAVLDAEGSSWISASISVEEWKEIEQNVDL